MKRLSTAPALVTVLAAVAVLAGGACSGNGSGCPDGNVQCGGCYDPARYQTDASNCGGCGIQCGPGATCSGGSCVCAPGTTPCPGLAPRCRDLLNDAGACGTCGTSCGDLGVGFTCEQGQCGCFGDRIDCGTVCTDTANDPNNCGIGQAGCAQACLSKQLCVSGQCECPPDVPTACATTCTNLQNDPAHCGACENACLADREICSGAACQCPPLQPDRCPAQGAPAACVNRANDPRNCGTCDHACPAGATCTSGLCQCPAGAIPCADACVPCAGGTCNGAACQCPAGPASGCNGRCCAGGDACCAGNCQTQHSNGLGQSYFNCDPLYSPSQTTAAAAQAAADAFSATGNTFTGLCDGFCIGRQTASQCAVWCYAGGNLAGRVGLTDSLVCTAACPFANFQTWN